ncbi:MAG: histone-like protein [Promethearchaeota archaeon]
MAKKKAAKKAAPKKKVPAKKAGTKPATKKKTPERQSYIAKAPIRRLMTDEGADLVAEAALNLLIEKLTSLAKDVTNTAIKNLKDDKRKKITKYDIINAAKK